ncbi:hypothetical protein [Streptomyces sp. XC 2026]|uniref:hypothetical protein n=1 Tax=Streptomyces sp. XC 2026 TaxID=2782004 RepID=UPI0019033062|nr:hypothetical protein [Streptomyces sp. XC 2026]QQN79737.1 hypothetical protein IPZ77_21665 [Streptomyces sp. XC 2026]QQN80655.1 hypothetical protein IPZ77_26990 [Streptomyces sp. XC 2026]
MSYRNDAHAHASEAEAGGLLYALIRHDEDLLPRCGMSLDDARFEYRDRMEWAAACATQPTGVPR